MFVDLEISTQADRAQSSRVPVPLPEDPYKAIIQAYLDGTDTESEPFEDPIETETPESPHTVAPPTSLPESTPPTLFPILHRTACMAMRVPPAMSLDLSATMAKVAAMFNFAFRKSVSKDAEDEGTTIEDEDPAVRDEGLAVGDKGPGMGVESCGSDDESHGLDDEGHSIESNGLGLEEEEEAEPEGQQREVLVVGAAMSAPLGVGYGALRRRELALEEDQDGIVYIDVPAYPPPAPPAQTPPSPEWSSSLLSIYPAPFVVPSSISSPMIPLIVPSLVASPATDGIGGFLTELGAQVEMQRGLIRDHTVRLEELSPALFERYDRDTGELFTRSMAVRDEIFSQRYRFRSIEHEQERVAVTFEALWRPVLALELWAGQTDAQRVALWHAISDTQGENRELRLQLTKERRAPLELAKIVDSMRRGQEPRGDV
ncbi:hypothetical protein Tco_1012411 [Tanacetum coccineum]